MSSLHTITIRLCPNRTQVRKMMFNLECCRFVYNETLEFIRDEWNANGTSHSFFDLCHHLVDIKREHIELNEAYAACLVESVHRVDKAMRAFFGRVRDGEKPGYPRFRGKGRYDSFTYTQWNQFSILDDKKVRLGKIGEVKYRGHVDDFLLHSGTRKTCTVKRTSTGKWYALVVIESDGYLRGTETFKPKTDVGVDLNIKNLATLSDGVCFPNERRLEREEKLIAKKQRQMSKHEKGTPMREKYRKHLAHRFERLNNRRIDDAHRISRYLVDNYKMIAFEDLDIKGMIDSTNISSIHKAYYSVAWNRIITFTGYKAEDAGIPFVKVNPAYTTQLCSNCGNLVPKTMEERTHRCDACGLTMDRDVNAAMNILNRGRGCRPLSSPSG